MIRILFLIKSLESGGKERRFLELVSYLRGSGRYELKVVLLERHSGYRLDGMEPVELNGAGGQKNPANFIRIYRLARQFRPDVMHAWDALSAFYCLPYCKRHRIPLINNQITNSTGLPPVHRKPGSLVSRVNLLLSDKIIANSMAGLRAYRPPVSRSIMIPNGIDPVRCRPSRSALETKKQLGVSAQLIVLMVAAFSKRKNYGFFLSLASHVLRDRRDVCFIYTGACDRGLELEFMQVQETYADNPNIRFTGRRVDIEDIIGLSDVCVLFSHPTNHGEGISNAILEYMAMEKPVIATDNGGTNEVITDGVDGYLLKSEDIDVAGALLTGLLDDPVLRKKIGGKAKLTITERFHVSKMGAAFEEVYREMATTRSR